MIWVPEAWQGAEHLTLRVEAGAIAADSTAIGVFGGKPCRVDYHVQLDEAWQVRLVSVAAGDRVLELQRECDGSWRDQAGTPQPELAGCTDIDIEVTPFTNTLPIRRLGLKDGESAEIDVVYIAVPALERRRARQRYTNLGGGRYRYESLTTGFTTVITLDSDGLVKEYPGSFRQVP